MKLYLQEEVAGPTVSPGCGLLTTASEEEAEEQSVALVGATDTDHRREVGLHSGAGGRMTKTPDEP